MNRRELFPGLAGLAGLATLAPAAPAAAQGGPIEGRHFVRLAQPMPTTAPPGKLEVIEFFWYGCPHCQAFEPSLDAWAKELPGDVAFQRVPVAFSAEPFTAHQRIYYALEALGLVAALHRKVFHAIHQERRRLDKPADIATFATANGVDGARFTQAYESFSTQAKIARAAQLVDGYRIDGVPAMGVHGRFYTSGTLAGNNERSLDVVEVLLQRLRKAG